MKNLLLIFAAVTALQSAFLVAALPTKYYSTKSEKIDDKAMYDPTVFEGDMNITPEQFEKYYGQPRSLLSGSVRL